MAYQIAATVVTFSDLEGHSPVAGLFKYNPPNICAAVYTISTDSVVALSLCISRASCMNRETTGSRIVSARNTEIEKKQDRQGAFRKPLRPLDM